MTILVTLLLALAVVILSGNALRRRRAWSRGTYLLWVAGGALFAIVAAALVFFPRRALP